MLHSCLNISQVSCFSILSVRQTRLRQLVKRVTNFQVFSFPLLPLPLSLKVVTGQPYPGDWGSASWENRSRKSLFLPVQAWWRLYFCMGCVSGFLEGGGGGRRLFPPVPASWREPCASFGQGRFLEGWPGAGALGKVATVALGDERGRGGEGEGPAWPHMGTSLALLLLPWLRPLPAKFWWQRRAWGAVGHPCFGRGLRLQLCSRREKEGRGGREPGPIPRSAPTGSALSSPCCNLCLPAMTACLH